MENEKLGADSVGTKVTSCVRTPAGPMQEIEVQSCTPLKSVFSPCSQESVKSGMTEAVCSQ